MNEGRKEHRFDGRLVILGFGSIGQGVVPLLLRHIDMRPEQMLIIKPHAGGMDAAEEYGVPHLEAAVDEANYRQLVGSRLGPATACSTCRWTSAAPR